MKIRTEYKYSTRKRILELRTQGFSAAAIYDKLIEEGCEGPFTIS